MTFDNVSHVITCVVCALGAAFVLRRWILNLHEAHQKYDRIMLGQDCKDNKFPEVK